MSRSTKLTEANKAILKLMVLEGWTPSDIADRLGVAISSIHNYKNQLKKEGMEVPHVRGKRPTGDFAHQTESTDTKTPKVITTKLTANGDKPLRILFNGTRINITSNAKEVNVSEEGVEVIY